VIVDGGESLEAMSTMTRTCCRILLHGPLAPSARRCCAAPVHGAAPRGSEERVPRDEVANLRMTLTTRPVARAMSTSPTTSNASTTSGAAPHHLSWRLAVQRRAGSHPPGIPRSCDRSTDHAGGVKLVATTRLRAGAVSPGGRWG
jgi:hypothetical protein